MEPLDAGLNVSLTSIVPTLLPDGLERLGSPESTPLWPLW